MKKVWFRKEKFKEVLDDQMRDYTSLGGNSAYGLAFLILFAAGWMQKSAELLDAARLMLVAGILFTIVGFGIKYVVARTRPNQESLKGASMFEKMNDASFPSIHSGRAIILAYVVGSFFPGYGKVVFWIAMLGIPVTRVVLKKHYWSDVITGALLGFLIAYGVNLFI